MALNLYRRHRRDCKAGHPEEFRTGEFDERKKGWKRCACPIFASGTLARISRRQSTGKWEWDDAKATAAQWEQAGNWDGTSLIATPPPQDVAPPARITIIDATEAFIAKCQNRGIAVPTLRKYKTFTKQLRSYADSRGYVMVDQLTVSDMDRFYASWDDGIRAKAKKLDRLKAFVKFCTQREWIKKKLRSEEKTSELQ